MADYTSRNRDSARGGRPHNEGGRPQRSRDGERRGQRDEQRSDRGGRDWKRKDDERGGAGRPSGGRRHAQRAGGGRNRDSFITGPQRPGYREERDARRAAEPDIPADVEAKELDKSVLQDLRSLAKDNADTVARHMIMAATLMADDPQLALRHARAAKDRGGRVSVVRETAGIAAYHAGEWKEALSELRAARRMSGGPGLIAVMADCERALGKPEKAIELARDVDLAELDPETRIELAIVAAGARRDMSQLDAALIELERAMPDLSAGGVSASRIFYAYADVLAEMGRTKDAIEWFNRAGAADEDELLDVTDRLAELS
ncbi:hypothetical protein QVA66_00010 [Staphylococcus chromogenes]|nr:hypothetical protein [Staphylococcus chromogenes]